MATEKRIYDFGNYSTSSEDLAEILFYLKKMTSVVEFSETESLDSLVEKQMAVSGYASRMKTSLRSFLKNAYQTDLDNVPEDSYAGKIVKNLNEMKKKTFYFREMALQLPADEIKANLQEAAQLAEAVPLMVAALDAGEDEVK